MLKHVIGTDGKPTERLVKMKKLGVSQRRLTARKGKKQKDTGK